jgi:hypothetical protein
MADEDIQPEPERRRRRHVREDLPDEEEDRPRRRRPRDDEDEEEDDIARRVRRESDATGGLIPYKNPRALIGYYMGVFSLIPCLGLVLGPVAIVLGILGLKFVKKHETAGGTAHAIVALVLGSLTTLGHLVGILLLVLGARMK